MTDSSKSSPTIEGIFSPFQTSPFDYVVRATVKLQRCSLANPLVFEAPLRGSITGEAVENKIHFLHDVDGMESGESFDSIDPIIIREHQESWMRVAFTPHGEDRPSCRVEIGLAAEDFSKLARYVTRCGTHDAVVKSTLGLVEVVGITYGPVKTTETLVADILEVRGGGRLLQSEAEEIGIINSHVPLPQHNESVKGEQNHATPLSDAIRARFADDHQANAHAPVCPQCGSAMTTRKRQRDGSPFYGCTKYPACEGTLPIQAVTSHGPKCPHCGGTMVRRTATWGRYAGQSFWGCSKYPDCEGKRS